MSKSSSRRAMAIHDEGVVRSCGGKGTHRWLAEFSNSKGAYYHILWCPYCGDVYQCLPLDRAATGMKGGPVDERGNSSNRTGTIEIQVCVIGVSGHGKRVDQTPMRNAALIGEIADAWSVPRVFRKGKWGPGADRSKRAFLASGIHGHCHGVHDDHIDPGPINVEKLAKAMFPDGKFKV
jgi:hypothetical protein